MSEARAFLEVAWRDGVGPDDLWNADAAAVEGTLEGRLFSAWVRLLASVHVDVPDVTGDGPLAVVAAAAAVTLARLEIGSATGSATRSSTSSGCSARSNPTAPHASAARAWADLALGQVAVFAGDHDTGRRRLETVAGAGQPPALRIAAYMDLAGLAMGRVDVAAARTSVRKALTIAELERRPLSADRARLALGLLEAASGDPKAARATLAAQVEHSVVARVLLAGLESAGDAMPLLAEGLRRATEEGDTFSYMMCILVGARRYVAISRDADALVTISAGVVNLTKVAPELAAALIAQRDEWRETWPAERWAAAETRALALVDSGSPR